MKQRFGILLAVLLALILTPALAQRNFDNVTIKATHVRGNVYMLAGAGGNIGVTVGSDGILIVDDQFAPLADKIRAALAEVGGGQLKFILNTHWHSDHTGGNVVFGPEATIIAHTNVRKRLSTDQHLLGRDVSAAPKEAWPVITFDQSVSVHFNDEEIKVMHLPRGHTDGDSVILFTKSNVLHMGDDFFAGRFPFVDLGSGGSVAGLIKNIKHVTDNLPAGVMIIPGHGPLSTSDDLKAYHQTIVETVGIIREKMKADKSLEAIQGEGLPEKYVSWGSGFISAERWIEIVYRSYSK